MSIDRPAPEGAQAGGGGGAGIDPRLLEILMCPACGGEIRTSDPEVSSSDEGGLACLACSRVYPIRDGIPVMLVEEATTPETTSG